MADIKAIPERIWVQWYGDGEPSEGVYDDDPAAGPGIDKPASPFVSLCRNQNSS